MYFIHNLHSFTSGLRSISLHICLVTLALFESRIIRPRCLSLQKGTLKKGLEMILLATENELSTFNDACVTKFGTKTAALILIT